MLFLHSRRHVKLRRMGHYHQTQQRVIQGAPPPLALNSPGVGGKPLAVFPRRSARLLDSDSELEQAARMFGVGSPQDPPGAKPLAIPQLEGILEDHLN